MLHRIAICLNILFLFTFISHKVRSQEYEASVKNVLFISSYAITYTWSDSLVSGVLSVFSQQKNIQLYTEFLDAKRFDKSDFQELYKLYKKKYRNIRFDVAIASDNDALDFLIKYGDSLFPHIPVVFCGINNPEEYNFENSNIYGIMEGIDLKAEIDMIVQVMPELKNLCFISDSATTTSLLNLKYIRKLEPEYAGRVKFQYIFSYSLDSLIQVVRNLEKGSAIALINYYQDMNGNALNPEAVNLEVINASPVPVFMESETLLGKGIAGGIFVKGRTHGKDVAKLALKFIENPSYQPPSRIFRPDNKYYFDSRILKKFNISEKKLPAGSVVINQPHKTLIRLLKYIIALLAVIGLLILIVMILYFNIRRRKKAEDMVKQKLEEIEEKNAMLEEAHEQVNEMNSELTGINDHLSKTNEELVKAKDKSEESDRLKSAFLANMSHEIRTPLNAIIGFSSLLNDYTLSPEERDKFFRIINSNGYQLLHIIEDILDLSKIEAGQLKTSIEPFSVHGMILELVESFKTSIDGSRVKIIMSSFNENDQLELTTDPGRFKQIISNLLSNAIKFTSKGEIEVGYLLRSRGEITFYVKDTGKGIEQHNLSRIFDRFWKAEEQEERFHSGAGLGLPICKRLCDALGGRMWAESEIGKGSVFYFTLPNFRIKTDPHKVHRKTMLEVEPSDLHGYTIAIAKDETSNLFLLTRILKKLNVSLISFTNGAEIVDFFRNNKDRKVDLILMDIKMPVMDGYQATRLIRELRPDIPIVAQTAYAMVSDVKKISDAGFSDYISKPIRPVILIEKVNKFLQPDQHKGG